MVDQKEIDALAQIIRKVDGDHSLGAAALAEAILTEAAATSTPSSRWAAEGKPDPHAGQYDCKRAALTMGDLSDDEMANAVFLHGSERPTAAQLLAGALPPIAYLTAAKDRIRWLSRRLAAATAPQPAELAGQQGPYIGMPVGDQTVARAVASLDQSLTFAQDIRAEDVRIVLAALAATGKQVDPAWSLHDRVEFALRDAGFDLDEASRIALQVDGKQQVGAFPWENLPSYLIDKCEGDTISEEGIQRAVADMAKDARYCMPQQVGEVQGDAVEHAKNLDLLRAGYHVDAEPRAAALNAAIAALAARQPGSGATAEQSSVVADRQSGGGEQVHWGWLIAGVPFPGAGCCDKTAVPLYAGYPTAQGIDLDRLQKLSDLWAEGRSYTGSPESDLRSMINVERGVSGG